MKEAREQLFRSVSWYYLQSANVLCIGPSGYGQGGDFYELEPAGPHLDRGYGVVTATWTYHAMAAHAQEVRARWKIPATATFHSEVPYDPTKK